MSPPKFSKFSSTLTLALILLLTLTSTWLLSLHPIRLKIGDYFFKQGKFDLASNWYGKVLRKTKLGNFYKLGSRFQSDAPNEGEPFIKFRDACLNSGIFHFEQSRKYSSTNLNRAELELRKVLRVYEFFIRNVYGESIRSKFNFGYLRFDDELSALVKKAGANLVDTYKLEKPRKMLELYTTFVDLESLSGDSSFAEERAKLLSWAAGVNLLDNPYFADSNNDGVPDGYTFACVARRQPIQTRKS